jgi:uncharacterized protein
MQNEIRHDEQQRRFELHTDGGVAVADYDEVGDVWSLNHTYVPPELRGQGVAAAVVKHALETARQRGKKVSPDCSYVAAYIARHSEYKDLLAGR